VKRYRVTIVGAADLVGQELIKVLQQRRFPVAALRLLASGRSAGQQVLVGARMATVGEATTASFRDTDLVFFATGPEVSTYFTPYAIRAKALVVDVCPGYRPGEVETPFIVPEVNGETLRERPPAIACPGSVSTILAMALYPLHLAAKLERVVVTTYQAVSEKGRAAMEELSAQAQRALRGEAVVPHVLSHQIAFNVLPETDVFLDNGYSREEWRVMQEIRRLLALPELPVSVTTAWVPVYIGHALDVHAGFDRALNRQEAHRLLAAMPGVRVLDDPDVSLYPHPWIAANTDDVLVGRVREDTALEKGLALWVVGDNLRKGQALNAVQIAELAVARGWL
jgi:aspartate-semialdehyde dehydrogenase